MTSPTATELPGTRERILEVALQLFAERGYEATSMRQISQHLGISKAALYYHFDSKGDIVRAMLADTECQVTGLVDWARNQPMTAELRREVLSGWSDIMQARGLAAFRFVVANRQIIHELMPAPGGMQHCLRALYDLLTPPDASAEDQLRTRLAVMSINLAGLAGTDIDADEAEILAAARRLALELLPDR